MSSIVTVTVTPQNPVTIPVTVGSGISSNYTLLANKPQINGVTLVGNKTGFQLGLADESEASVLRQWIVYLTKLLGRIPLYNVDGTFTGEWATVGGVDTGDGVYNLVVDTSNLITTPTIPPPLQEPQ